MGLSGQGGSNKTFVSIIGCRFTIRTTKDDPDAKERVLTKGKNEGTTVYELRYSQLSGMLMDIRYTQKEDYGDFIEIELVDDDGVYVLQVPWTNFNVRDSFIKRLPNVDIRKEVVFKVFPDKESGNTVFFINQDDEIVKSAYTKDNPNGMPQAVKKTERGKDVWDFKAIEEFLYNKLHEFIPFHDKITDSMTKAPASADTKEREVDESTQPGATDEEIPF